MKAFVACILVFALSIALLATPKAQASDALEGKSVRELIDLYIDGEEDVDEKDVTHALQQLPDDDVVKYLSRYLKKKNSDTWSKALYLAQGLESPGLYEEARDIYDTHEDYRHEAIFVMLQSMDEEAAELALTEWFKEDIANEWEDTLADALWYNSLHLKGVERLCKEINRMVENDEAESAEYYLQFANRHLACGYESLEDFSESWQERLEELQDLADDEQTCRGVPFRQKSLELSDAARAGDNVLVAPEGWAAFKGFPDDYQTCDEVIIRFNVLVPEGEEASVGIYFEQGVWSLTFADDEWQLGTGTGMRYVTDGEHDKWTEFEFKFRSKDDAQSTKYDRSLKISIDGKPITNDSLSGDGKFQYVGFRGGAKGIYASWVFGEN